MRNLPPVFRPPSRDGVSATRVVMTTGPEASVAEFLATRLRPGIDWPARLAEGGVLDAEGRPVPVDARCRNGKVLWYWRALPDEVAVPFEMDILYRDEHLVVVDKPHFLAALPGGQFLRETAQVRLRRLLGNDELVALHRLDRETAGVLMFSARPDSRDAYHALLRDRKVRKVYEAVAPWRPDLALPMVARHRLEDPDEGRHMPVRVVEGEPNCEVTIELLRPLADGLAHYRLSPLTGRRHQLRAQMAALGLPIVGDRIYPRLWPEDPADFSAPLQLLARELAFVDPLTGEPRCFTSRRVLERA